MAPVVKPERNDLGISITIVNLVGTLLMFLLPLMSKVIFHGDTTMTSALIGGVLQSVGQVIGAGQLMNSEILELATIFKIVRIIFIVAVVAYLGRRTSTDNLREIETEIEVETNEISFEEADSRKIKKLHIPWYIKGFFIFSLMNTAGTFPEAISHTFHLISSKFEIIALAGIGMRVKLATLFSQGPRAIKYGLAIGVIQIVAAVSLIEVIY